MQKDIRCIESKEFDLNPGYALFLDFKKAFDTVSREFLVKSLKKFNFGEKFIATFYTNFVWNFYALDFRDLGRVGEDCGSAFALIL